MRFFLLASAVVLISCSSSVSTSSSSTTTNGKYSEDLSSLRTSQLKSDSIRNAKSNSSASKVEVKRDPTIYVDARHTVNQSLDVVLDSIDRINLSYGLIDGFTIQLYSGTKRDEALNVKKQLSTALPQLEAEVQFVQPNFRVRTGRYYNRFDAQRDYMAVKKYFPNAIIIPDRIPTTANK